MVETVKLSYSIRAAGLVLLLSLLLSSLELSDTNVHEPQMQALLGTASYFCEVVVLRSRTLPSATGTIQRQFVLGLPTPESRNLKLETVHIQGYPKIRNQKPNEVACRAMLDLRKKCLSLYMKCLST